MRMALRDSKVICVSSRLLQKSLNAREIIEVVNSYQISNLTYLIKKYKPDIIFNFSGLTSVAECQQYPEKSLAFNFQIVEKLVEAIKISKNKNCLFPISDSTIQTTFIFTAKFIHNLYMFQN